MAISTLILGESGTGKSASLRNFDPNEVLLFQCTPKPLPFRASGWNKYAIQNWQTLINWIQAAVNKGKKIIVIDDFQYLMAHEYMTRAQETGFQKFTEIGLHAYSVIQCAINAPDDVRIYFLSHTESSDLGKTKCKTIGKMLDEKITIEGLFTIVLRTNVEAGNYSFSTQNNGQDTVKSPMGLFETQFIDNDLKAVDDTICQYYDIN